MVAVRIETEDRNFQTANESWINQQINLRRRDGQRPRVRVRIEDDKVSTVLLTPGCPNGAGGGRQPNPQEKEIFDLWDRLRSNTSNFIGGNLVAFLKQLSRLLS